jgi:hypothetical protein
MMCNIKMIHTSNYLNKQYNDGLSLVPVGLALLVMALSLTAIAISFTLFGHVTGYASKIMELQQKRLRQQYGLAPAHIVTDPKILQVPPSLRDMLSAYYNNSK